MRNRQGFTTASGYHNPSRARERLHFDAAMMRIWRSFFGFGSLVFGLAVAIGFDVAEYYLLFRLFVLNAIFYGYLRPRQRLASKRALEEVTRAAGA